MPERGLRPLALMQFAMLLATFVSPAYAAGAVADPLHHSHWHAADAGHHQPGDVLSGQRNLFMFSMVSAGSAMMDAVAR